MKATYNNAIKEIVNTDQHIYDAFNDLIFSSDIKIIAKLLARAKFMQMVVNVPGDVVELGVFKGSGMASFLKLKDIYYPSISPLKVIGFDFFNTDHLIESLTGDDREKMNQLFKSRNYTHTANALDTLKFLLEQMGYNDGNYELVPGDINTSVYEYVKDRPGFRARLVYIDVDIAEPTFNGLNALWDRVLPGGVIVFDEVGISQWTESNGVDQFFKSKNLKLISTNLPCPTAYIVKPNY